MVTALDLDRPVVCGLSTGGCIAQVYAARHPDRIGGLVLADTSTPKLFAVREVPDAGHASNLDNPEFFTAAVREFLADVRPPESEGAPDDAEAEGP